MKLLCKIQSRLLPLLPTGTQSLETMRKTSLFSGASAQTRHGFTSRKVTWQETSSPCCAGRFTAHSTWYSPSCVPGYSPHPPLSLPLSLPRHQTHSQIHLPFWDTPCVWGGPNHSLSLSFSLSMGEHSSCSHTPRKGKKGLSLDLVFFSTISMTNKALHSASQYCLGRDQFTGWRMLITDLQTAEPWSSQPH